MTDSGLVSFAVGAWVVAALTCVVAAAQGEWGACAFWGAWVAAGLGVVTWVGPRRFLAVVRGQGDRRG